MNGPDDRFLRKIDAVDLVAVDPADPRDNRRAQKMLGAYRRYLRDIGALDPRFEQAHTLTLPTLYESAAGVADVCLRLTGLHWPDWVKAERRMIGSLPKGRGAPPQALSRSLAFCYAVDAVMFLCDLPLICNTYWIEERAARSACGVVSKASRRIRQGQAERGEGSKKLRFPDADPLGVRQIWNSDKKWRKETGAAALPRPWLLDGVRVR